MKIFSAYRFTPKPVFGLSVLGFVVAVGGIATHLLMPYRSANVDEVILEVVLSGFAAFLCFYALGFMFENLRRFATKDFLLPPSPYGFEREMPRCWSQIVAIVFQFTVYAFFGLMCLYGVFL